MTGERSDFDSPWKETLEKFLRPFLALCFPQVEAALDWHRPVVFLDKELQSTVRDAETGRQYVDKLIQAFQRNGQEQWVLVHVEVQTQTDTELSARMFRYYQRLLDAHRLPLVSLVVLADEDPTFRPGPFELEFLGCRLHFEYPWCKILDLPEEGLGTSVGRIIRAHRAALRTAGDPTGRHIEKTHLVHELYGVGFAEPEILELYRLIDWLMPLPEPLEIAFRQELAQFEQQKFMPFITSIERLGREEGLVAGLAVGRVEGRVEGQVEGVRQALLEVLASRFSDLPPELPQQIEATSDQPLLRHWLRLAATAPSLEAFREAVGGC